MKTKEKIYSGSLKIDPAVYARLVKHCDENRLKINLFASDIIDEKLSLFQAETVPREKSK